MRFSRKTYARDRQRDRDETVFNGPNCPVGVGPKIANCNERFSRKMQKTSVFGPNLGIFGYSKYTNGQWYDARFWHVRV